MCEPGWLFASCIVARVINRIAVVRDPYARWCGRGETARSLPIPIKGVIITTTFRYQCYGDLLKSLGNFDAICGYATIAVDYLNEELGQNPEPRDWLARYSRGHGVTLHDVDDGSLSPRLADMFVMLVHSQFEDFLRSFLIEHLVSQKWPQRGDEGLFEYIIKNLSLLHSKNGADSRETIEYYRLVRNAIAHPGIKLTRLQNQRTKLRVMLKVTKEYMPPKMLGALDYGDFFMFTRAVKSYAAIMCQAARPSDSEIADLIASETKQFNRFRIKPLRFRNCLRQYLQMKYKLDKSESDSIIDIIIGR